MSDTYRLTDTEEEKGEGQAKRPVAKRHRTKGPPSRALCTETHEAFMLKRPTTERGLKQLEIPWSSIPESERPAFRKAESLQWREHLQHEALEPVGIEESREILGTRPERVLPSRFAYRDKAFAKRKLNPSTPWRHKSRLVGEDISILISPPATSPRVHRQCLELESCLCCNCALQGELLLIGRPRPVILRPPF